MVTLTVVDDNMTSATTETKVIIGTSSQNQQPIADTGGPYSCNAGELIGLDGSDSYDPDGTITNYTWNFGDGTKGYGILITHLYSDAGTYIVDLIVTDNEDETHTTSTSITVTAKVSSNIETPGFEFIFIILAAAVLLLWRKTKKQ